jgi:hypothetical protein
MNDGYGGSPETFIEGFDDSSAAQACRDQIVVAKAYVAKKLALHVHVGLKTAVVGDDLGSRHYCTVFEHASGLENDAGLIGDSPRIDGPEFSALGRHERCDRDRLCLSQLDSTASSEIGWASAKFPA